MRATPVLAASVSLLFMLTLPGRADTFGFCQLEGDNPELVGQFSVDVNQRIGNPSIVDFSFHNAVPGYDQLGYCSVTDVYFYGQDLIDPASCVIDQTGCAFAKSPTTPPDLPGWKGPPTALVYSIGIQGNPSQGLDSQTDQLQFAFSVTDAGALAQLLEDLRSGAFVVGLKVQAIWPCDDSATFVTTPVPAAALLGMLGLATAGMKLRKFV